MAIPPMDWMTRVDPATQPSQRAARAPMGWIPVNPLGRSAAGRVAVQRGCAATSAAACVASSSSSSVGTTSTATGAPSGDTTRARDPVAALRS